MFYREFYFYFFSIMQHLERALTCTLDVDRLTRKAIDNTEYWYTIYYMPP